MKKRRIFRNLILVVVAVAVLIVVYGGLESRNPIFKLSMATAYAALFFLAAALSIGPFNILSGRANPVSTYLRRDVGIIAGILSLIHVVMGLQVHFTGRMWLYFIYPLKEHHWLYLRHDIFGFANHSGLIAALIVVMLLCLSNNKSMRKLGSSRWKRLQRWNYVGVVLIVGHGILFQLIEKRSFPYVVLFTLIAAFMIAAQVSGYLRIKRRRLAAENS